MTDFVGFPKIPRYSRDCICTEKIDGTSGCIYIGDDGEFLVGSRTRWIDPLNDNYGFARWAYRYGMELRELGPGTHHGEWWGQGIQRGYGLKEKRFSLFNVTRWCLHDQTPRLISVDPKTKIEKYQDRLPACCSLVPILSWGLFTTELIDATLGALKEMGSQAVPGWMRPEGIVIFHVAGNLMFKKTLEKDEEFKGKKG